MMKRHYSLVFGGVLSLLVCGTIDAAANRDLRAQASFYIDTYGLVNLSKSPLARRAHRIFDRIRQVAEDPIKLSPTLKIINSSGRPWAVSLPDGYIILSRAALDICYKRVSRKVGDARLAFVLGHELAHLTANDFWHRKIYLSLSGKQNDASLKKIRRAIVTAAKAQGSKGNDWRDIIKRKELQADDAGFLYASLAGYRTDLVFSSGKRANDFLKTWVKQTRTYQDNLHFSAGERSAFLSNRFKLITAKVEYFMSGVRLAHFGRFEDAAHFFEEFQRAFPAHEVLNNLGYIHLQLARKHMPASLRYHYWLPTVMENAPAFVMRKRTMDNTLPPLSMRYLQRSIKFLKKASSAHAKNLTGRIVLSTAYLYLGQYHKARVQIEEARKLAPKSARVAELRAIILYEQEKDIDMWPTAIRALKKIAGPERPTTWYNLARLYEDRGRHKQAKKYWSKIVSKNQGVPEQIFLIACKKLSAKNNCSKASSRRNASSSPPFRTRVKSGASIESAEVKKYLNNWQHQHEEIGPLPVDIFISKRGDLYLAVDYQVTLVVVKNHSYKTTRQLLRCCGKPVTKQTLGHADLWSYGPKWSVLVEKDKVLEFWINDG